MPLVWEQGWASRTGCKCQKGKLVVSSSRTLPLPKTSTRKGREDGASRGQKKDVAQNMLVLQSWNLVNGCECEACEISVVQHVDPSGMGEGKADNPGNFFNPACVLAFGTPCHMGGQIDGGEIHHRLRAMRSRLFLNARCKSCGILWCWGSILGSGHRWGRGSLEG